MHRFAHHDPSTNGAPQVIAVLFVAMIPFMAFLPIAELTLEGTMSPLFLVNLIRMESGFNIFALLLLIAPVVGIAEGLISRSVWRGASALIVVLALLMMALTFFVLIRQVRAMGDGTGFVSLGIAGYIMLVDYVLILLITGVAAFRTRGRSTSHHGTPIAH